MATGTRNNRRNGQSSGEGKGPTREKNAPVFKRRIWSGAGACEVSVFEKEQDGMTSHFVAVRRTWKNDDGYQESNLFSPHELLVLADAIAEAYAWVKAATHVGQVDE